jgi:hypothetical protein
MCEEPDWTAIDWRLLAEGGVGANGEAPYKGMFV